MRHAKQWLVVLGVIMTLSAASVAASPDRDVDEGAALDADEDLEQLVAEADQVLRSAPSGSDQRRALEKALEGLRTALGRKADSLEAGGNGDETEEELATRRQELQTTVERSSEELELGEGVEPGSNADTGTGQGFLSIASECLDQSLDLIQRIQSLRAAFQDFDGGGGAEVLDPSLGVASAADDDSDESGSDEGEIESLEEVSGVVVENGEPVPGAVVREEGTGATAVTDEEGRYTLENVPGGGDAELTVQRSGRVVAGGRLLLGRGRSAIADFDLAQRRAASRAAVRVTPSRVVLPTRGKGGAIYGAVRDAHGRPLPRALICLDGRAFARTDSRGNYRFSRVPLGPHRLVVVRGRLQLGKAIVRVDGGKHECDFRVTVRRIQSERHKVQIPVAGRAGRVHGHVRSATGWIGDARVLVSPLADRGHAISVRSRGRGEYRIGRLAPGKYRLLASKPGYRTFNREIVLTAGATERCDIRMERSEARVPARAAHSAVRVPARAVRGDLARNLGSGRHCAVRGSVNDQRSRAVEGTVLVTRNGRALGRTATTGGTFQLFDLEPGRYYLAFTSVAGHRTRKAVTVRQGSPSSVRLRITR